MHPSELFKELKKRDGISSDTEIARLLGLTQSRISQMRGGRSALTARQVAAYLYKSEKMTIRPSELFKELRKRDGISSDTEIARLLGLTQP